MIAELEKIISEKDTQLLEQENKIFWQTEELERYQLKVQNKEVSLEESR